MEQTIVLIHTVRSVISDMTEQVRQATDCKVMNILDESLVQFQPGTPEELARFRKGRLLECAQMACRSGADLIAISCSSMTPHVPSIRPFLPVPVVTADDLAVEKTVEKWKHITLMATAQSTADIMIANLHQAAERLGKKIAIDPLVSPEMKAFSYRGDRDSMRGEAIRLARDVQPSDGILLAQASIAFLREVVSQASGLPCATLTTYMIDEIRKQLHIG